MSASIKDIVEITGLSLGTVSNYLNGKKIKEANRLLIESAIKQLNYRINYFGRNLKTNRSYTIGVTVPKIDDLFVIKVVSKLEEELRSNGYAVIICDVAANRDAEREIYDFLIQRRVDGVIIFPFSIEGASIEVFSANDIGVVAIDNVYKDIDVDTVVCDNYAMSYEAVAHLVGKGHKKIGGLFGPAGVYSADERLKGFRQALIDNGIAYDESLIRRGEYAIEDTATILATDLLSADLTAVFASNYFFTLGMVVACNLMDKTIGKDVSLVGFDNLFVDNLIKPRLTIMAQDIPAIAHKACEILMSKIEGGDCGSKGIVKVRGAMIPGLSVLEI